MTFFPTPWLYQEMKEEKTVSGGTDPRLLATILSYEPDDGYTTAYGLDWFASPVPAYTTDDANGDGVPEDIFIKKFTRADQGVVNETASLNSGINHPVIRYADVLLMNAEAKNELGQNR